ncbi:hypothetical protein ACRRTK_019265 [Alexandromys fortis]
MLNARGRIRLVLQVRAGRCHSNVLDAQILGCRRRRSRGLGLRRAHEGSGGGGPEAARAGRVHCPAPAAQA